MRNGPSLPQTPPGFSQGPGLLPASILADSDGSRLALEGALDRTILIRGGTDDSPTGARDGAPGSVRTFPHFEHGAGI